ncbi:MAG: hypothetical protein ABIH34_01420 [Nanoarchaeota archaeon]
MKAFLKKNWISIIVTIALLAWFLTFRIIPSDMKVICLHIGCVPQPMILNGYGIFEDLSIVNSLTVLYLAGELLTAFIIGLVFQKVAHHLWQG